MQSIFSLWMTLALGLFMIIGLLIVFLTNNNEKFIEFSFALALGVIIMLILFDLIPEAYELLGQTKIISMISFVLLGIVLLKILDLFLPGHDDKNNSDGHHHHLYHIGFISSIALILHNIIEGMAIYTSFTHSISTGVLLSIGVGIHNIPLGMVITSTFYQENKSKTKTFIMITLLSLSTFIGGLILYLLNGQAFNEMYLGILLSITLGMLLYIGFFELLPKVYHSKYKKISILGVTLGILLLVITLFF